LLDVLQYGNLIFSPEQSPSKYRPICLQSLPAKLIAFKQLWQQSEDYNAVTTISPATEQINNQLAPLSD
jgi:hypothetical protein